MSYSKAKIAVIYYSTYGHITKLTEEVVAGAKSTGAHVDLFQIPETLSDDILAKQHAIQRPNLPVITSSQLTEYDGFIFGFPTRYGRAPAQVSAFFDSTGKEWASGALVGKFATIYTSAASQHGGLETTALTTMPFFIHHGISYVPSGFTSVELSTLDEIIGGSAYGAGTVAGGDGSRQPTGKDLAVAKAQGTSFSTLVNTYVAGKSVQASHNTSHATTTAAQSIPASAIPPIPKEEIAVTESKPYVVDTPIQSEKPAAAPSTTTTPATIDAVPTKNTTVPAATGTAAPKAQQQKKSSIWARCCGSEKDYAN